MQKNHVYSQASTLNDFVHNYRLMQ